MEKKDILLGVMNFFLVMALLVIGSTVGSNRDPKIAQLLQPPHPHRIDQNIGIRIPATTPPRSPRPQKIYEKAVRTIKQQPRKRLNS